jgi:hypothetical protein
MSVISAKGSEDSKTGTRPIVDDIIETSSQKLASESDVPSVATTSRIELLSFYLYYVVSQSMNQIRLPTATTGRRGSSFINCH